MIRVERLCKFFGPTRAVDDITFEVEKGEVVGFLGPNGAGKTTTIRVLTCFHPATAGKAEVAGFDVFRQSIQVRRNIGYLAENVPIYPDLRVEEFLSYRAALKGVARSQRKAAVGEAMERCGVLEVRRKLVGHVSRGYRQRVGLADALVSKPPILILDEPTSGLDPNQRRKVKTLVRELAEEHTILFSSHILSEVEDVSSRIMIIDRGKIRADGAPQELLSNIAGRRLLVTAKADAATLTDWLTGLEGVHGANVKAQGSDGYVTVEARLPAGADLRDEAFSVLQQNNVAIRELTLRMPTLEEFFRTITEEPEGGGEEAA